MRCWNLKLWGFTSTGAILVLFILLVIISRSLWV
ncbi:YjcZ family sporulation protein [Paenibacillus larvae]|nr:YjcZ family sporulation protein [Paenibacillus larvae]